MSAQTSAGYVSVEQVSKILSTVGGRPITPEMIQEDISDGAPTNPDGNINLTYYAAWLAKEMGNGD